MNETLPAVANGSATPARVQLGGAIRMKETIEDLNMIRSFVGAEMKDGLDFGKIPGTGDKKTLLLPGAQKVAMYFNCFPEVAVQTVDLGSGHVEYVVTTKLVSRSTGMTIGSGLGSCSTMESKYRFRNAQRTCPKCGQPTIFKSKRGDGFFCWEKKGGCGANFRGDDRSVTDQDTGKVENDNIYDQRNTVLKMAKKRSLVDASISLGCMSELFTQDLEDFREMAPASEEPPRGERDSRRQEVNEEFDRQRQERPRETFRQWCKRIVDTTNDDHLAECAMENAPNDLREKVVENVYQVEQHLVNVAIESKKLKPEQVEKADKPGKKDPKKVAEIAERSFAAKPDVIKKLVTDYIKGERSAARAKAMLPDPDGDGAFDGKGDAYEPPVDES